MYQLIETNAALIIDSLDESHVEDYKYLIHQFDPLNTEYQMMYRKYFRMNPARLSQDFYSNYFNTLSKYKSERNVSFEATINALRSSGSQSIQASFASKLLHVIDQDVPIYDSLVRDFYFYKRPNNKKSLSKIDSITAFHEFLREEYQRIDDDDLLTKSIKAFDSRFQHSFFSTVKKIDSLIWAFVRLMQKEHPNDRAIKYY